MTDPPKFVTAWTSFHRASQGTGKSILTLQVFVVGPNAWKNLLRPDISRLRLTSNIRFAS